MFSVFPDTCSLLQLVAKDARSDLETDQDPRIHWLAPVFLACLGLGLGGEWFTSEGFNLLPGCCCLKGVDACSKHTCHMG